MENQNDIASMDSESEEDEVTISATKEDDVFCAMECTPSNSKNGRPISNEWSWFTDEKNPQVRATLLCKHCFLEVKVFKKISKVKNHLNRCSKFAKFLQDHKDPPSCYSPMVRTSMSKQAAKEKRQSSMMAYAIPKLSPSCIEDFQVRIAKFFYAAGIPFQRVEHPLFKEALAVLRPGQYLPSRKSLSNKLLDQVYRNTKAVVDQKLKHKSICIISDGWSNIKNEPVVNYMFTSPTFTIFREGVYTRNQGHTGEWIAADIDRVLTDALNFCSNVAGAVTDNTSANKKAWRILKDKYPTKFFQGCCSHGLNLLVKDLFGTTKKKRAGMVGAQYPDGYPFEDLLKFVDEVKTLVKYIKKHPQVKGNLENEQMEKRLRQLSLCCETRWCSIKGMLERALESEKVLNNFVTDRDFLEDTPSQAQDRTGIHQTVISKSFVANLKKSIAILEPIDYLIVKYQKDSVPVSEVCYDMLFELNRRFEELNRNAKISDEEYSYIQKRIKSRNDFLLSDAHYIGFILDPRYLGKGLADDKKREVMNVIATFPISDTVAATNESTIQQLKELTNFITTAEAEWHASSPVILSIQTKDLLLLDFWNIFGDAWPSLQKIAINVFTLAPSSAASERNFSTFGFIHSKLRNCLKAQKVNKLVYIKTNMADIPLKHFYTAVEEELEIIGNIYDDYPTQPEQDIADPEDEDTTDTME